MTYIIYLVLAKKISSVSVPFLDASLNLHASHFLPSAANTTGLLFTTHSHAGMQATCAYTHFFLMF